MKNLSSHKKSAFAGIARSFCASLLLIIFGGLQARADEAQFTQNSSTTRSVTVEVPLANNPGRGISLPVKLRYSSQGLWRIGFINSIPMGSSVWRGVTEAIYAEHSTAGWTTSLDVPKVEWPKQNDIYWYTGKPYPRGTVPPYTFRVANLYMHMPDGSTHEMRKADAVYQDGGVIDMAGTFYSVDGSRMRYDSTGQNTGTLYLPNGTRYIMGTSTCQVIDRNGNVTTFARESASPHRLTSITDPQGRETTLAYSGSDTKITSITDFAQALQLSGFFKMPVEIVTTLMETVEEANVIRFVLKAEPKAGPVVPATGAAGATVARLRRRRHARLVVDHAHRLVRLGLSADDLVEIRRARAVDPARAQDEIPAAARRDGALALELGRGVVADRARLIVFGIGRARFAVEDVVGRIVNQQRAEPLRLLSEEAGRDCVYLHGKLAL